MNNRREALNAYLSRSRAFLRNRFTKSYFFFVSELIEHRNFGTHSICGTHSHFDYLRFRRFRFFPEKTRRPMRIIVPMQRIFSGGLTFASARIGFPRIGILTAITSCVPVGSYKTPSYHREMALKVSDECARTGPRFFFMRE